MNHLHNYPILLSSGAARVSSANGWGCAKSPATTPPLTKCNKCLLSTSDLCLRGSLQFHSQMKLMMTEIHFHYRNYSVHYHHLGRPTAAVAAASREVILRVSVGYHYWLLCIDYFYLATPHPQDQLRYEPHLVGRMKCRAAINLVGERTNNRIG